MTTLTPNYRLTLPDFNQTGWDTGVNGNFSALDTIIGQLGFSGTWTNSTFYAVGRTVIDGTNATVWVNGTAHTTAAAPATFLAERTANPSYWTNVTSPSLPLAGGTLTGGLVVQGTTTLQSTMTGTRASFVPGTTTFDGSGNINRTVNINTNLTGTTTGPGIQNWGYNCVVNADTLNQTAAGSIAADIGTIHNFGGAGFHGARLGFFASLFQTGAVTGTPGVFENVITGAQLSVTFTGSFGGSGTASATCAGFGTALNPFMSLKNGAVNIGGISGMEIDVLTEAGTSARDVSGMLVFRYPGSAIQATRDDIGIIIASPAQAAGQGWHTALSFGSSGSGFAIDPLGTLIGSNAGTGTRLAAKGVDFTAVTFSTSAWASTGYTVDGSGNVTATGVTTAGTVTAATVTVSGTVTGATVASTGAMTAGTTITATGNVKGATYLVGANQVVAARDTGWTAMTGTPDKVTVFATSTVTLAQLAGRVMQLQAALTAHGLIGA